VTTSPPTQTNVWQNTGTETYQDLILYIPGVDKLLIGKFNDKKISYLNPNTFSID